MRNSTTHAKINDMNTPLSSPAPAVNSKNANLPTASITEHRRQAAWQILVPLFVGVAVILAIAGLAVAGAIVGNQAIYRWSDISLIFLIIPAFGAGLTFVVLFAGFIFLFSRLLHLLPRYTRVGQTYAQNISNLATMWSNRIASPMMSISSFWAGVQAFWRGIFKH